jgi:hypothetical protein
MNQIKSFKTVILVWVVLLVLVIFRYSDQNVFRSNPKQVMENVLNHQSLIKPNEISKLTNPYLIIELDNEPRNNTGTAGHSIKMPFEKIMERSNRKVLDETPAILILSSDDIATATKAYVILDQLGYKNVKILSTETDPEAPTYKFVPDTSVKTEQDSI